MASTDNIYTVIRELLGLLRESVLVQACVTGLLIVATVYLLVTGQGVPDVLKTLDLLVLGFYFGSATTARARAFAAQVAQVIRHETGTGSDK